jgi:hypothetical protein
LNTQDVEVISLMFGAKRKIIKDQNQINFYISKPFNAFGGALVVVNV